MTNPENANGHVWVPPDKLVRWHHCRVCGIIKRYDGKNSLLCKGPAKVTLRRPQS